MDKGMYTYDIISTKTVMVRLTEDKDLEENTFDNLNALEEQLESEGWKVKYKFN